MDLVVVDVANVMGSRPDGWWRDRAGAAIRLRDEVVAAGIDADVVLVVEGRAKGGPAPGVTSRVRTVHASGSGDDAVVEVVRDAFSPDRGEPSTEVVVVTADRGLRRRVEQAGARVLGPGWLLERL